MISTKKAASDKPLEFPCLLQGKNTGAVLLATRAAPGNGWYTGTVIHKGSSSYNLGQYRTDWESEFFTPYNGTIALEN